MRFSKFQSSAGALMLVLSFSKILGMLRDIVLANYFGTSKVSDAYLIAVSVPTLLFYFIGHALSTAYLPMFNKVRTEQGKDVAQSYSNNILNIALVLCTMIVAVLLIWPEIVIKIFAAGFDQETICLTSRFIRLSCGSIYAMTIISVFTGFLQANGNFIIPAMVGIPRNIVIMLSVVVASMVHISSLGWGLLLAYVAEVLVILPVVWKEGYRYRLDIRLKTPETSETLHIILPIILGVGVSQINKIVDKSIASTLISGGVSALSYASIINNAVQEIFVTGIITILFANCSALVAAGKHEQVKKKLKETLECVGMLLIPASFGVVALAHPIVICILQRGYFDERSVNLTVGALCFYTVGMFFIATRDTLVKVFYAYKNTHITTITSIISILLNIVLNIVLSSFMGISGLALATSVAAIFQSVLLYIALCKQIGDFGTVRIGIILFKEVIAAAIMFIAVKCCFEYLGFLMIPEMINLIISVFFGVITYGGLLILFKVPYAKKIVGKILQQFCDNDKKKETV